MFGTLEGVITCIYDLKLVPWRKEIVTGCICAVSYLIGLLFCQRSGEYWLQMFDTFSASLPLLLIALFEVLGVSFVYGTEKFEDDIEYMISIRPGWYWTITWRYISPVLVSVIIVASLINMGLNPIQYKAWVVSKGETRDTSYPSWGFAIITLLIVSSAIMIPAIFILRYTGILKYEKEPVKGGEESVVPPSA